MQPEFKPFSSNLTINHQCDAIIGNSSADPYNLVYTTQGEFILNQSNITEVHLAIMSLNAEGIVEHVDYQVDYHIEVQPDTDYRLQMGQGAKKRATFDIELSCADVSANHSGYATIQVGPDIGGDPDINYAAFSQAVYSAYVSTDTVMPSFEHSEYNTLDNAGMVVLTFPTETLLKKCFPDDDRIDPPEAVNVYVSVVAEAEIQRPLTTIFRLSVYNHSNVIHSLHYGGQGVRVGGQV